ncbi:hypothetical protein C8F04DRAFT_1341259 [Mycena alexandri]|uniref:BTB domain-containing protein n=1 Tax=Mycena alexandri TaxID=1745969 RepID=A0AAD6WKB8_9AGAR|nr:hypothetical protein C8F04DRAFT_1341259 [Mycena alexandri]
MAQDLRIAAPPFDDTAGDVIIQSSDNVSFYVHKTVIYLASPVFADTLMLASPTPSEKLGKFRRPHLPVAEDSKTLYRLLSWCDPRCAPSLESKEDVLAVLEVADKYCMDQVMKHAADILLMSTSYVQREPMKVFAVATRYHWVDLAKMAARYTLNFTWEEQMDRDTPELKHISAVALRRLETYQLACKRLVIGAVTNLSWFNDHALARTMGSKTQGTRKMVWKPWFLQHVQSMKEELYLRPSPIILPKFIVSAAGSAYACSYEGSANFKLDDLAKFNNVLKAEIDRIVSQLAKLPFTLCIALRLTLLAEMIA